jgi:hypothetical protein
MCGNNAPGRWLVLIAASPHEAMLEFFVIWVWLFVGIPAVIKDAAVVV